VMLHLIPEISIPLFLGEILLGVAHPFSKLSFHVCINGLQAQILSDSSSEGHFDGCILGAALREGRILGLEEGMSDRLGTSLGASVGFELREGLFEGIELGQMLGDIEGSLDG